MTAGLIDSVTFVSMLCSVAQLPVLEAELGSLAAAYTMIAEGTESLRELDGFDQSATFTVIQPTQATANTNA
jgi:hypothetical protein